MQVANVTIAGGDVMVRHRADTENVLGFTPKEWSDFIAGVKAGEFDYETLKAKGEPA